MRTQSIPKNRLLSALFSLLFFSSQAQTIMFDDFTYTGISDPQLPVFNKWQIINGASGPPEGAQYSRNNITFVNDPSNASNKIMTLSTTVNGTSKATTHARIETSGFEYFEGTYAARVYLSDEAFNSGDGNIQTFYTIVSSGLAQDGSKYSEMDIIEYMASDKWGVSPNNRVGYITSYHKYIANPWKPWKTYNTVQRSLQGWHTFIATCTDGVNIRYYMDGVLITTHSVTDNETEAGLPVYPRSNMQVAFANWIWNNVLGSSSANRTNTMQADWVLYYKNQSLSPVEVDNLVNQYRSQGLQRRNLAGQTYITGATNQLPTIQLTGPANGSGYTAPATVALTATASDPDGTVAKVEFFNGSSTTPIGTDNTAPYSFNWTNVAAGTYSITAKVTDNLGATATTPAISITVTSAPIPQTPYGGTAWPIPGIVEAENYDLGGQGVAFNELTAANEGGAYRTDPVDIEITTGGGYNAGYILTNEWLEYTVNITSAGAYNIDARVATTATGKTFRLELDGVVLGNYTLPNTTGWQIWQSVTLSNINLTAGQKVLRVFATSTDFNLDKLVFTKVVSNVSPTVNITAPLNNTSFTAPATINITANASDADGTISKVEFFNGSSTTPIGTDNSTPYSFSWTNVAAGTYTITAKATDNAGAGTVSSSVTITVTNPNTQTPYGGTPWAIPGTIEAENYDLGGQDIAFHELTTANEGGAYRTDPVDIEITTGGGFNLGYIITGEWVEYTVNVSAGTYNIDARVATTLAGKNFRLELDGATIATINVPNTSGWQIWQTASATNVVLTGGQKVLRLYATTTDFNVDKITFTKVITNPTQTPYGGTAWPIPGTVEAENYDVGGQGIAFNDVTTANQGAAYRTDAVDVETNTAGGFNLGYIVAGEWVEYTVNVTTAGTYTIDSRVAAIAAGKNFRIELDGSTIATVTVPNTGGWQIWQSVVTSNVVLTAGQKILRIYGATTDFNVDKIIFTLNSGPAPSFSADALLNPELNNTPNPFTDQTIFTLDIPKDGYASVKIYDKNGMLAATIFEGYLESGIYEYEFDASSLKPDVYIIKYTSTSGVVSKTIIKL